MLLQRFRATATIRSAASSSAASIQLQEMPSPKGLPFIGTTLSLIAAGSAPKLHLYADKRHSELGKVFREKIGPVNAVFVSDAAEIRNVFSQEGKYPCHIIPEAWLLYNKTYGCKRGLLFMDGEEWLQLRRVMNKLLLRTDTKWINSACDTVANSFVVKWKDRCSKHNKFEIPDLEHQLYRWSVDVILSILLGSAYEKSTKSLDDIVNHFSKIVNSVFTTSAKLQLIPASFASRFRLPSWRRFVSSVDEALSVANTIVTKLIDECEKGNDGLLYKMQNENLSREDIQRVVADLILAAGDTTAYSMMWTLFLLSTHENIQEKLAASIGGNDGDQLLKGVIKETLRLYPVAPFLTRIMTQDVVVGGYQIPTGTLVIMSLYSCGRDANYFQNPDQFMPERWFRDGNAKQAFQNASLPFAMGARSCIGRKIAEAQMNITVGKIVENFQMKLLNEKPIDIILKLVAVPSQRLRIQLNAT